MDVQTRLGGVDPVTETQHHALLVGLNPVDRRGGPADDDDGDKQPDAAPAEPRRAHQVEDAFAQQRAEAFGLRRRLVACGRRISHGVRFSSSIRRARALSLSVWLLSWPQAARMSRPRGVRTGLA